MSTNHRILDLSNLHHVQFLDSNDLLSTKVQATYCLEAPGEKERIEDGDALVQGDQHQL